MHGAASVAFLFLTLTVLCPGCIALPSYTDGKLHSGNAQREDAWNATVNLDLGRRHPIPTHLFGLFFEEIGHAGDGGLYAELVQDRSFDAIAAATRFLHPTSYISNYEAPTIQKLRADVNLVTLATSNRLATESFPLLPRGADRMYRNKSAASLAATHENDIIIAWQPLPSTLTSLTREKPLNPANQVSMEVSVAGPGGGIINLGYWGIRVDRHAAYGYSLYVRNPGSRDIDLTVALASAAGLSKTYASDRMLVSGSNNSWVHVQGELLSSSSDSNAVLVLSFDGPGTLVFDSVSLFPAANIEKGKALGLTGPWPFREDLLQALKDLRPGFLRFPGGCFVEGDWMRNAFVWKNSVGRSEARPGHMNGVWGYWSTDGLGLFEYMLLAEELDAAPIWVVNNGVAHGDSVPASDAWYLVQDALDSMEFISGPANSTWGALRAAMGRLEPWSLDYLAIGNEDCGKPFYTENYNLFFGALRSRYPHLRLISNCDMGQGGPTDLWDWHVYTNPRAMFDLRHTFDGRDARAGRLVFASEYAVTDGGGWGNLVGAVAEAGFMTGLERNAEAVPLAAYAPLFVNWNNRPWPTNMIVFDNHRWFGIPSYHVQRMFRQTQGTQYISTTVAEVHTDPAQPETIAASATCQNTKCSEVVVKLVNFSPQHQSAVISLLDSTDRGVDASATKVEVASTGELVVLTGSHPEVENSFDAPFQVAPFGTTMEGLSDSFVLPLAPWSVSMLMLQLRIETVVSAE